MTPAHFVTWPAWALLGLNLIAEAAVFWLAVSRRFSRRLIMLPVFAGFCLLADIGSIVLGVTTSVDAANGTLWVSRSYWLFFWGGQIIAGVLVLLLALQIITAILPPWDRLITLLGLVAFISLAVIYYKLLPSTKVSTVLAVVTLADVVTGSAAHHLGRKAFRMAQGNAVDSYWISDFSGASGCLCRNSGNGENNGGNCHHRRSSLLADWHGILFGRSSDHPDKCKYKDQTIPIPAEPVVSYIIETSGFAQKRISPQMDTDGTD